MREREREKRDFVDVHGSMMGLRSHLHQPTPFNDQPEEFVEVQRLFCHNWDSCYWCSYTVFKERSLVYKNKAENGESYRK